MKSAIFFSPSLFFSSLLFSYGSYLNRKLLPDISGHLKWIQVQAVPRKGRYQPLPGSVFLPCYPREDLCMCEIIWLGYLHLILEHHKGVQVVPDKRLLINKPLASPSITVSDELHAFCVSFSSSLGKISSCRVLGAILQQGSKEITLQL